MTEEEATAFAEEHMKTVQLAASGTYLLRTVLMLAALVSAFLFSDHFNVLATVIPLIMCRPIMYVAEILRIRFANKDVQTVANSADASDGADDEGGEADPNVSGEGEAESAEDDTVEAEISEPGDADAKESEVE